MTGVGHAVVVDPVGLMKGLDLFGPLESDMWLAIRASREQGGVAVQVTLIA